MAVRERERGGEERGRERGAGQGEGASAVGEGRFSNKAQGVGEIMRLQSGNVFEKCDVFTMERSL